MVDQTHIAPARTTPDAAAQLWHAPAELLDSLPVALCLCDRDGRLVRFNRRAAELWGWRPPLHELIDRSCGFARAFPSENEGPIAGALREGGAAPDAEIVGERPDGSRVNALILMNTVKDPTGAVIGAIICFQDITARKRLEQTVTRRMGEQAALYEFTDRLFRATTRHEVYDAALDAIIRALGCSRASILLFDEQGKMEFVAWRGLSEAYRAVVSGHSPWRPGDRNAKPICIEDGDVAEFPDALKEALRRERIRGLAFIPLTVDGAVIGKFMTYYATPHRFETEEIELAVMIARQLGFRIERLRSEEARTAAERALNSERELLRTIIDRAPVMLTLFHPETGLLQLNRQFEQLIGWRSDENTAAGLMEACYPDPADRAKIMAFIEDCSSEWMDVTMRTRSGRVLETSWANFRLSDGTRIGIGIEITDRKRAEAQQALLLGEMGHRLRNLFAVASSVVDLSAREAQTPDEMAEAVHDRFGALTRAHDLTRPGPDTAQSYPAERETTLHALLTAIFSPYSAGDTGAPRFTWRGCDLRISGEALTGLALLLHEFMTNAAKHGALSRAGGLVEIDCAVGGGELALAWRERGGPPLHGPQGCRGFGAYMTERVVAGQFNGRVTTEWEPEGLLIRLWLPLDRLMAGKARQPD